MKDQLLRLGEKALTYGVGSILNRFISFLLLPLFTKFLTPADYGISSILGWMTFLVTPIFSLGIGSAMAPVYFEKKESSRKETTVWSAFTILFVSVSVMLVLGVSFAKFWSQLAFQKPDYQYYVLITFISAALSILSLPFILHLQFEEKAKLFAIFTIINTIVSIGFNVLFVVVFRRGVQGVIEANLITQVVNLTLFAIPTMSKLKFRFQPENGRELLRLGVPLIPSFIFVFILQQGNRYVLQMFGGLDGVGIYTIGYNFGLVMSVPVDALTAAWVPYFMGFMNRREEASLLFGRIVTFYVIGFGVLSLMFYAVAKPVVMIMTQPKFYDAYQIVGLSATAYFLSGLFSLLLPAMYFAKEVKYVSLLQGATAVLGVGINFLLIPRFQIMGAGLSLLLNYLIMIVLVVWWNSSRKSYYLQVNYEWRRIILWILIYTIYALILSWHREFPIIGEGVFSMLTLISLPFIVYMILNSWERHNISVFLKEFRFQLLKRSSV